MKVLVFFVNIPIISVIQILTLLCCVRHVFESSTAVSPSSPCLSCRLPVLSLSLLSSPSVSLSLLSCQMADYLMTTFFFTSDVDRHRFDIDPKQTFHFWCRSRSGSRFYSKFYSCWKIRKTFGLSFAAVPACPCLNFLVSVIGVKVLIFWTEKSIV